VFVGGAEDADLRPTPVAAVAHGGTATRADEARIRRAKAGGRYARALVRSMLRQSNDPMTRLTKFQKKRLLIAAVGVASVNYVTAGCGDSGTANAPSSSSSVDAGPDTFIPVGNLAPPPRDAAAADATQDATADATSDAAGDVVTDAPEDRFIITGNLAPPPIDAGDAGSGDN
jgi:hypothetical protein